jgi:hypothetical protein
MRDHDDAIAFFQTRGFYAGHRDWALGDTVVVGLQPEAPTKDGIQVLSFVLWLVPREGSAWDVVSSVCQHERRLTFATLDLACEAALRQLSLQVIEDVCPSCQGRLELRFGERIFAAGNRWYQSTRCRDCGDMTEADGDGELPDQFERIELSRNGRWSVFVASAPPTAGWAALQKTLGLDLPALAEMRRRVPGVVVEGTFAQALRLSELFNRHGASAKISEALPST